jgi:basic membrane lipoprotein Med (substrate-binding protein (PBP1-ABC) superfamily)
VTKPVAALVAMAAVAAGCGSDLGPASTPAVVPVRVQLVHGSPQLAAGVRDAVAMVGARRVEGTPEADLVVTASASAAAAASRVNPGTHILLVTPRPPAGLPANVRAVEFDDGELAYLAGALAALRSPDVAVVQHGGALTAAFRAGTQEITGHAAVSSVACGAVTSAAVVYVPDQGCRPAGSDAAVIAPRRLPGADMLALLGPRPAVVVAQGARSVQDGVFEPGAWLEGLREDAIGFAWISPVVPAGAVDRLQHVEDRVRAETAPVPSVAP